MSRIALFGTSADPPTEGHQSILTQLAQKFDRVLVWAADNPFKSHGASLDHRQAMLFVLINSIYPPRNNILLKPELSSRRTIETVHQARKSWLNDRFTLVIGSDLVSQIPRWYKINDLLGEVNLLVVPRPGYNIEDSDLAKLRELGGKVAIANWQGLPVSSTDFRQAGDPNPIPAAVADYIARNNLYQSSSGQQS
ncbi:MAG: nicotinate-nucleotide adenylyltransferase [Arthrospira sp. SH-MAG29]|nr:nicotinate-nucleotide adenylyltransferase [Arthrospira sp. SH-MAG29]MBS0016421.1 nicotinate-nucleotide adenylyltransferase [Arthrospira sp. SH-MAG29]